MRLRIAVTVFLLVAAVAQTGSGENEWLGSTGQRVKSEIFRSGDAGAHPVLVA
jgi:hypothetical protein